MRQTQLPKENTESYVIEKALDAYNNLDYKTQGDLQGEFIRELSFEYNRRFFRSLRYETLIKERWFLQFLIKKLNIKDDKDI